MTNENLPRLESLGSVSVSSLFSEGREIGVASPWPRKIKVLLKETWAEVDCLTADAAMLSAMFRQQVACFIQSEAEHEVSKTGHKQRSGER